MKKIITSLLAILVIGTTTTPAVAETVIFNTNTHKYHKPSCKWAKKCTVNCVPTEKKQAVKKGVPCKVCGG